MGSDASYERGTHVRSDPLKLGCKTEATVNLTGHGTTWGTIQVYYTYTQVYYTCIARAGLGGARCIERVLHTYRITSLIRNRPTLGSYNRPTPTAL